MAASAAFTVNAASNPAAHSVAYGATVTLALVSTADVASVTFSIVGASKSGTTFPTLTPSGVPSGSTATFTMPSDPGDGLGRSFRVKCRVIDQNGDALETYGVVGAVNNIGLLPVAAGETLDRDGTYGWTDNLNNSGVSGVLDGDILLSSGSSVGIGTASPTDNAVHILGGTNPSIRLEETSGRYLEIQNNSTTQSFVRHVSATGDAGVNIDGIASDGSSNAVCDVHRYASTSGQVLFNVHDGSGSYDVNHQLDGKGDLSACIDAGDMNVGSATNVADIIMQSSARISFGSVIWLTGSGTPESSVTAPVGSLYTDIAGGASTTLYVKESGTGNTGWVAK